VDEFKNKIKQLMILIEHKNYEISELKNKYATCTKKLIDLDKQFNLIKNINQMLQSQNSSVNYSGFEKDTQFSDKSATKTNNDVDCFIW
jgi:FtsZ-binding cell division protein ZapB